MRPSATSADQCPHIVDGATMQDAFRLLHWLSEVSIHAVIFHTTLDCVIMMLFWGRQMTSNNSIVNMSSFGTMFVLWRREALLLTALALAWIISILIIITIIIITGSRQYIN